MHLLELKLPWTQIQDEDDLVALQEELDKEIGPNHKLWALVPKVIGRRVDMDDVLVRLSDSRVASVHLVWNGRASQLESNFPSSKIFATESEFLVEMNFEAEVYE